MGDVGVVASTAAAAASSRDTRQRRVTFAHARLALRRRIDSRIRVYPSPPVVDAYSPHPFRVSMPFSFLATVLSKGRFPSLLQIGRTEATSTPEKNAEARARPVEELSVGAFQSGGQASRVLLAAWVVVHEEVIRHALDADCHATGA